MVSFFRATAPDSETLTNAKHSNRFIAIGQASVAKVAAVHTVLKILVCGMIGIGIGVGLATAEANQEWTIWLGMPGTLYLRALQCLVGPLVFCSVVLGFAALGDIGAHSSVLMKHVFALYMVTTLCAIGEGLFLVLATKPIWDKFGADKGLSIEPSLIPYDHPSRA